MLTNRPNPEKSALLHANTPYGVQMYRLIIASSALTKHIPESCQRWTRYDGLRRATTKEGLDDFG